MFEVIDETASGPGIGVLSKSTVSQEVLKVQLSLQQDFNKQTKRINSILIAALLFLTVFCTALNTYWSLQYYKQQDEINKCNSLRDK
jgi:hypothetical protein